MTSLRVFAKFSLIGSKTVELNSVSFTIFALVIFFKGRLITQPNETLVVLNEYFNTGVFPSGLLANRNIA